MPLNIAATPMSETTRMRVRTATLFAGAAVAIGALASAGVVTQVAADEAAVAVAQQEADRLELTREVAVAGASEARMDFEALLASEAESAIEQAAPVIAAAEGKADASVLSASVTALAAHESLPPGKLLSLVEEVEMVVPAVQAAVAEADRAAAEAARVAAQQATPAGAQEFARQLMASQYGWGADQASCLINLWQKESNWRHDALNASSGATGIPQALPGSKMATHGADWQTNPQTQIAWGLDYIKRAYGTPCGAWSHSQSNNWY